MRFPLFALIAPLIASVVLWAVTGSAITLLFALLGPVMALAQFADGKLHGRRQLKQRQIQLEEDEIRAVLENNNAREEERQQQLQQFPSATAYCGEDVAFRPLWAAGECIPGSQRIVRLGVSVGDAFPVVLDLSAGVAVQGDDVEVAAALRALAAHLAWKWGPAEAFRVEQDLAAQPEWLKLDSESAARQEKLVFHISGGTQLPPGVRYLLKVSTGRGVVVDTALQGMAENSLPQIDIDFLTRAQAQPILRVLQLEREARSTPHRSGLPEKASTRLVESEEYQSCRTTLVVCAGEQATQPLFLDLVSAGPHAVVTGMTGSGKTEFLRAWLLALCCSYSPDQLSLLIVDFKGGAGFQSLAELPHVAGLVTDLNPHEVHRAVTSLRAEIRYRERILVDRQVTDIRDLPLTCELTRLIVVVDEYRALLERFPDFAQLFVDLSSRGRALGIHMIVSSQQIGGAIGDALLANCALRISFRVAQKQDSLTVLGTDAAHSLEHAAGRALLMGTGIALREFHAPLCSADDIHLVASRAQAWSLEHSTWQRRRPWLAPLPRHISLGQAPERVPGTAWLGLADLPEHQVQSWVTYSPAHDGNLLVAGPARSGVSTVLHLLAEQCDGAVIDRAEHAWDVVVEQEGNTTGVLILDNLDTILEEFTLEHREEFVRCLTACGRELPRRGQALIANWSDTPPTYGGFAKVFSAVLNLQDAQLPGRARWKEHEVQLASSPPAARKHFSIPTVECQPGQEYVVITRRLNAVSKELSTRYPDRFATLDTGLTISSGGGIYVGTPDAWLSRHAVLQEKLSHAVVVLDSCSPSELRSLRLSSRIFPYVEPGKVLLMEPGGLISRAQMFI